MPGLTPKAIDELYRHIDDRPNCQIKVTTYFVELYNDNLVDLYFVLDNKNKPGIADPPKLDIKMDAKKMVYIRNAIIKEANSPSELMDLFNSGNLERHTGKLLISICILNYLCLDHDKCATLVDLLWNMWSHYYIV